MPRHILIKLTKTKHKERILKSVRAKQQVTYKGNPICFRPEWNGRIDLKYWKGKGKNLQPRLLYVARISFKIGEIKSFSDKQKLREFSTTKPALQQMLKGLYSQEIQEKKKIYKIKPQTIKKMAIGTYISIITLNVNGFNA